MTGAEIYNALLQRGYSPYHAAALGGHILQESGGDPTNVNAKEDAHGLLQWRGPRWNGLQSYALSRNASPSDPDVQIDYIAKEMSGPEAKAGAKFLASGDLPSASAALKGYIRFGDNSDAARLAYGQNLLGGNGAAAAPVVARSQPAPSPPSGNGPPSNPEADTQLTAALQNIPKQLQTSQQEAPQITPLDIQQPMPTPAMIRARQLASAMVQRSLNPGTPT